MASTRSWSNLTATQQKAVVAVGAAEAVLTAVALVDLVRRPRDHVRGPKALWLLTLAVQPVGPLAYLRVGRKAAAPTGA